MFDKEFDGTFLKTLNDVLVKQAFDYSFRKKSKKLGLRVTKKQVESIFNSLMKRNDEDEVKFKTPYLARVVEIISSEGISEILEGMNDFSVQEIQPALEESVRAASESFVDTLISKWPDQAASEDMLNEQFQIRLKYRWKKAVDFLKLLLTCCREIAQEQIEKLKARNNESLPIREYVLQKLHARCCQITGEIIALIESGFADGAMARWRTMHEIYVVYKVLSASNDEVVTRYIEHQEVSEKKELESYIKIYGGSELGEAFKIRQKIVNY